MPVSSGSDPEELGTEAPADEEIAGNDDGIGPEEAADGETTPADGEAITAEGLEALKRELYDLEGPARRGIAQRILTARGHGDLKENAEYHAAKEDQAHLETRIARLRQRLRNAMVVDTSTDGELFTFGRTAEVVDEDTGVRHTWTIVGPTEANLASGRVSAESPVARALLGAIPGQVVEVSAPRGKRRLRVERVI